LKNVSPYLRFLHRYVISTFENTYKVEVQILLVFWKEQLQEFPLWSERIPTAISQINIHVDQNFAARLGQT
jgi:hypothetical protein